MWIVTIKTNANRLNYSHAVLITRNLMGITLAERSPSIVGIGSRPCVLFSCGLRCGQMRRRKIVRTRVLRVF
ncbi:hypothetical protein OPV22_014624 [Ensete ventricosum]|uniref:Uncharacterized protein n=1 Tax=Ensete ventricosum TaxID=4639 RepID=A0AAV8R3P1_ENSVE|nr:hypothetical protein OPV22_014624 [Ensete ventricosum]